MGNTFFDEMNALPPGYQENFNEDAYIDNIGKKKVEGGVFGDRKNFQEMIFGTHKGVTETEHKLITEIDTLLSAKGFKQTQQGRNAVIECVKHLKKLGIING